MLSHISFGVADLERSMAFYDAVLAPLGVERLWQLVDGAGYGFAGGDDRLALKQRPDATPAGPGFHCAFEAPSREAVDALHVARLCAGGRDNGGPGLRPHYGDSYYAAFLLDPEGYAIEALCQG